MACRRSPLAPTFCYGGHLFVSPVFCCRAFPKPVLLIKAFFLTRCFDLLHNSPVPYFRNCAGAGRSWKRPSVQLLSRTRRGRHVPLASHDHGARRFTVLWWSFLPRYSLPSGLPVQGTCEREADAGSWNFRSVRSVSHPSASVV